MYTIRNLFLVRRPFSWWKLVKILIVVLAIYYVARGACHDIAVILYGFNFI